MTDPREGDRVIGRALKLSLLLALAGVLLVALAFWVLQRSSIGEAVSDSGPGLAQEAATDTRAPEARFVDITDVSGIDFVHASGAEGESLLPETMGGGVAFFDADGDGDADLLLVDGGTLPGAPSPATAPSLAFYLNDGSGQFTRVDAEASGLTGSFYGMGLATGDYDGDARIDVYVTAVGANRLYRYLGEGRFEEVTAKARVAGSDDAWSSSAVFTDIDNDDDLDLFVVNYVAWSREIDFEVDYRLAGIGRAYGPPTNYPGSASFLFRNEGDGTFSDVSEEAGVVVLNPATGAPSGKGLAVIALDVNGDDWVDLLVANDTVGNYLLLNDGDGTFTESGTTAGLAFDNTGTATGAMGMDAAWYDDAQTLGVAVGNFANEMSSYYVSEVSRPGADGADHPVPVFTDEAAIAGIGAPSRRALTFGLLFFDYDLDGHQDLLQVNGHVEDEINVVQPSQQYAQSAQLFWRCAAADCARPFVALQSEALGQLAQARVGRGAAYADLEGDGDLDLLLTAINDRPLLLRNDTPAEGQAHWLRVRLRDEREGNGNRFGLGATVRVMLADGAVHQRLLSPARSYLSQVEAVVSFGLGAANVAENVIVRWPDGVEEGFGPLTADALWELRRGESEPRRVER